MEKAFATERNKDRFVKTVTCRIAPPTHLRRKNDTARYLRIRKDRIETKNEITQLITISTSRTCMEEVRRCTWRACPIQNNGAIGRRLISAYEVTLTSVGTPVDIIAKRGDGNKIIIS
jgi:hypothetical protein